MGHLINEILTDQQHKFCSEYVRDFNAKQAAVRAGYKEGTASNQLMQNPLIQEKIRVLIRAVSQDAIVEGSMVLSELQMIATSDVGDLFNTDGGLKPIHEIPERTRRSVAAIEIEELFEGAGKERVQIGFTKRVKFWDKNKALEMLGKHLGLFSDKLEVTGRVTLEDLVVGSNRKPSIDIEPSDT